MRITLIRLELELLETGGIIAPEHASATVDLPLATDAAGNPWYPPTSLAGAMRRLLGPDADRLLGYETDDAGRASAIRVLATHVQVPQGRQPTRRVRNAMDRERGAPRATFLFSSEALPAGSTVEVQLRWDDASDSDLAAVLEALSSWRPVLGRGGTVGHGRCRVTRLGNRTLDLDDDADLLDWLCTDGPDLFETITLADQHDRGAADLPLDVRWRIADALHIGTEEPEADLGEGPQVSPMLRDGDDAVVPGSTWKGVLRARCEYVLRSLGVGACLPGTCGECPTCQLFGWGPPRREDDAPAERGARGSIRFLECVIEGDPLHGLDSPHRQERQHVAIDRATGGAHDGLLYTDEILTSGSLRLRVEQDPDRPRYPWARGLLLTAVADIADGLLGIGSGTTRGQGTLQRVDPDGSPAPALTIVERDEVRHAVSLLRSDADAAGRPA